MRRSVDGVLSARCEAMATVFAQAAERIQRTNERLDIMEERLNKKMNTP